MFARYLSAITTGTVMTLSLFYLMQLLIDIQPGAQSEPRPRYELGFAPEVEDSETMVDEVPRIPKDFIEPPPVPPRPDLDSGENVPIKVSHQPPEAPAYESGGPGFRMSDGPLVAVIRVAPVYPARMAQNGIEGWVIVEFDVLADGSVANVSVVGSSHSGFEKAAVTAAYKFRYKARVVDGVPLVSHGIQNKFSFEMEQ